MTSKYHCFHNLLVFDFYSCIYSIFKLQISFQSCYLCELYVRLRVCMFFCEFVMFVCECVCSFASLYVRLRVCMFVCEFVCSSASL